MYYSYQTFWFFDRYMHHDSATAGGLCWLFNGSHKTCCIQSPCEDGGWENSFCRPVAELLNYLFNWEGEKNWFLGFKKIFMDPYENVLSKNIGFFFPLTVEKKKKKTLFHSVQTVALSATQYAIVFQSLQLQSPLHVGLYLWQVVSVLCSLYSLRCLKLACCLHSFIWALSACFPYVLSIALLLLDALGYWRILKFMPISNSQIRYAAPQNLQLQIKSVLIQQWSTRKKISQCL